MATPLLQTKLYIPPPRPGLVSRPRLIERLDEGLRLGRKLTLISAPAGFGKTTLLSEWLGDITSRKRAAWLSLDEEDNDPVRFLTYLVIALQTVENTVGHGVLDALRSSSPLKTQVLLTNLLNELAVLSNDVVLIFDDYHLIESGEIDAALSFILDHLPPMLHLVIASRSDPSLPLARLRGRGQLTEVREADLRFTTDEAATFVVQSSHLPISHDDLHTLEARTEGWITGLQLAVVAMQSLAQREQMTSFVGSFGGSHRYVIDYLVDEVLDRQTPEIQAFLLQTSILERLTGSLCDAVTCGEGGQDVLEQLEAANLFLISLDGERHWYRYHHLFADLLVHRLGQAEPERVAELHGRASVWHEHHGLIDDAFRHAQAAGDTARAADIVEEHWQESLHRGELTKLKRWLDTLGPECTEKSAPLSMAYCWIHHLTGANDVLPKYIQDAQNALRAATRLPDSQQRARIAVIPSLVETMESIASFSAGQVSKAKTHAQKAISLAPAISDPVMRTLVRGAAGYRLASAHRALGEYDQARTVLLDVLDMFKASQNCLGVANAVWLMAAIYRETKQTAEAIALCEGTVGYIREQHWENMPSSGMVYLVLADLQADAGDREAAEHRLEVGRRLVEPLSSPSVFDLLDRVESKLGDIPSPAQPLVEPLSKREREILALIAQGLSNREIGERLFLALSTVKGHNRNIYGKLQVQRRTEAVARARELGLL